MTTNFSKISTKKLNEMLATETNPETISAINEVLSTRQQLPADVEKEVIVDELTAEEQAIMDKAEATANEEKKTKKLSQAECDAIAEELKPFVGRLCKVVPAGKITWEDGQIVGVIIDKRSNRVLYMIKLKDKKILKAYNSEFLQISEESAEIVRGKVNKQSAPKMETDELLQKAKELAPTLVGQKVKFAPFKPIDGITELDGIIVGITPEKRVGKLLIKIRAKYTNAEGVEQDLIGYKTEGNYTLLGEVDEETVNAYNKRQAVKDITPETPLERLTNLTAKLEKAKEDLEKLQKSIEVKSLQLVEAEAAYKEWLANQTSDAPGEEQTNDDLT